MCSSDLIQTKEQRKAYEVELRTSPTRKSIATAEVNDYAVENYIKKLDETIEEYVHLLKMIESYICSLIYIVSIAEDFIINPEFDTDFYEKVLTMSFGRSLILKLLKILVQHLLDELKKPELINKFMSIVSDLFSNLTIVKIEFEEEKSLVLIVIEYVEQLITEAVRLF